MTGDRRTLDAQYGSNLSAVAAKCRELEAENRELRAEVIRRDAIIVAVREVCRANFDPESRYGRAMAKALGDSK